MEPDSHLRMDELFRLEAMKAIMDYNTDEEIRRAINRRTAEAGA